MQPVSSEASPSQSLRYADFYWRLREENLRGATESRDPCVLVTKNCALETGVDYITGASPFQPNVSPASAWRMQSCRLNTSFWLLGCEHQCALLFPEPPAAGSLLIEAYWESIDTLHRGAVSVTTWWRRTRSLLPWDQRRSVIVESITPLHVHKT